MTKYILHGGETGIVNSHNAAFYQSWVQDFKPDTIPTILLVYFSRARVEWERLLTSDTERLRKYTSDRPVNLIVASADLGEFMEQVKAADVVYFRGGSTADLISALLSIKDKLLAAWEGKIVAGSSAGAMMLSQMTRSADTVWMQGLGLLPINSFVHYSEKYKEEVEKFKQENSENDMEYLLIPETEFFVKEY